MSRKLNENQLIAVHLIASGVKASVIANKLSVREEINSKFFIFALIFYVMP